MSGGQWGQNFSPLGTMNKAAPRHAPATPSSHEGAPYSALDRLRAVDVHQRLELAARAGKLGIWDYCIGTGEIACDRQWMETMGLPADRPITTIEAFRRIIHPDDVERATSGTSQTAASLLASEQDYSIEFRIIRPDGEIRWVRSMGCIIEDEAGMPWRAVGFVTDITEARLAEQRLAELNALLEQQNEELSRQALVDPLTSIANRRRFDREYERACADARRNGTPLAIAMIDVDLFKSYNDTLGHVQGDAALSTIAEVLASGAWRPYDLAARIGGEEFALILPDTADPAPLLERIRRNVLGLGLRHPTSAEGIVSISTGCRVVMDGREPAEDILAAADAALYRAKSSGRNRVVIDRG